MKIIKDIKAWQTQIYPNIKHQTLGFVPTMGHLHKGHTSLIKAASIDNQLTIVSIFINPLQFNSQTDYINYPQTLAEDISLLTNLNVDYVFLPQAEDIYPEGADFKIEEHVISHMMEGFYRPGHFIGVLTIVMKLLQIIKPTVSYFGEKDYQQYFLIKKMAEAFFLDTQIIAKPTIREPSLLAYSSRNSRLTPAQKLQADKFAQIFHQGATISISDIKQNLLANHIEVEYIQEWENRRFIAVNIGEVRLIDNYSIEHIKD